MAKMFCEIYEHCEEVFLLKLFAWTAWTTGFVLKQTKRGFEMKFGTFGPSE